MKINRIFFSGTLAVAAVIAILAFKLDNKTTASNAGFAVVELFTSEGCSSCPPADAVVARLLKESEGKPVYILGFHVDYWNHLGWKDEFSKAEYSARQRQYAQLLRLQSVYTPQIVVNGKTEFVGSEEGTLRSAIKTNLTKSAGDELSLSNVRVSGGELNLQYQTKSNGGNRVLLVAFVQKAAQSKVKSGENGGNTLSHVNIVRDLNSSTIKGQGGNVSIKVPQGYNQQGWEVIGFVQNTSTGEILSAQKVLISGV